MILKCICHSFSFFLFSIELQYQQKIMKNTRLTCTSTTNTQNSFLKLGNYTLMKNQVLGKGAFSTVYLTVDEKQKLYATKVLSKNCKQSVILAKTQATFLSNINHPNIVRYYSSYQSQNNFYIILSYHKGKTLREHINNWKLNEKRKPILPELIEVVVQVIQTVKYLFQKHKIVHKDIKPQNIIYSNNGKAILLDFGFAKKINSINKNDIKNQISDFVGTLPYMSPQILQQKVYKQKKQDIWSLGIFIYEVVTYGKIPWKANTQKQMHKQITTKKLTFPKNIILPQILKQFICKCLIINPQNRLDWDQVFWYSSALNRQKSPKIIQINQRQVQANCYCSLFSSRNKCV